MFSKNKDKISKISFVLLSVFSVVFIAIMLWITKKNDYSNSNPQSTTNNIVLSDKKTDDLPLVEPNSNNDKKTVDLSLVDPNEDQKIIKRFSKESYNELVFNSVKKISTDDIEKIYSLENKAKSSFDESNKNLKIKEEIFKLIKNNIEKKHWTEVDKILKNDMIDFESLDSSMKIFLKLNNFKKDAKVQEIIVSGFKTKLEASNYKLFKDIEGKIGKSGFTHVLTYQTSKDVAKEINDSENKIYSFRRYSGWDLSNIKNINNANIVAKPNGSEINVLISIGDKKINTITFKLGGFRIHD